MKRLLMLVALSPAAAYAQCDPFPGGLMPNPQYSCNWGRGGAMFALPYGGGYPGWTFYGGHNLERHLPREQYPIPGPGSGYYQRRYLGPAPNYGNWRGGW